MRTYALVTGASSGLGKDFAEILAQKGYGLILVARRETLLTDLAKTLRERHAIPVIILAMDLADPNAAARLYEQVTELNLTVEVLVNNAGYGIYGMFTDINWAQEQNMMQLDMLTLVALTKLFSKPMVDRGKGYILQVASIGGFMPVPTYATYGASKSFVLHFGEALNYELKNTGVKVSVLAPGVTATEFLAVSGQKPTLYQRLVMMNSKEVAQQGIHHLFRGTPSVVPGFFNKLAVFSLRFMPRSLGTWVTYLTMKNPQTSTKTAHA